MSIESQLREKLRKIEALFAGAGTAGERLAAEAALERGIDCKRNVSRAGEIARCRELGDLDTTHLMIGPVLEIAYR